jgi:hypothetical protein
MRNRKQKLERYVKNQNIEVHLRTQEAVRNKIILKYGISIAES